MTPTPLQFLIVCPLAFLAGAIDAVAGGGGLITLPAYLLVGLPAHNAIATNKLSSTIGTSIATVRYGLYGYVEPKLALVCVPMALIGSTCGAQLALLASDRFFKVLMLFVLPLAAWYVLRSSDLTGGLPLRELPWRRTAWTAAGISLGVGMYDGFYGPGTGTFLLLLLTAAAHMDLQTAAGTTKIVNLCSNAAALFTFILYGKPVYALGLAAAVFSAAGNWLGAAGFAKRGIRLLRPVILIVLVIFFIKVISELI